MKNWKYWKHVGIELGGVWPPKNIVRL